MLPNHLGYQWFFLTFSEQWENSCIVAGPSQRKCPWKDHCYPWSMMECNANLRLPIKTGCRISEWRFYSSAIVCQELKSMKYGKLVSLPFVWCLGLPHNQRCVYVSVYVHCWPSSKVYPRNWGFHSALGSNWRYTYTTTRVPRQPAPLRFSFSSFGCHWLSLIKTSSSCRILFTFNYI